MLWLSAWSDCHLLRVLGLSRRGELLLHGTDSAAATNVHAGWPADARSHTDADSTLRAAGDHGILRQRRLCPSRAKTYRSALGL